MKEKAPIGLETTWKPAVSTLAVAVQLCLSSSLSTTFTTWSLFSVLCYYADMDGHRSSILAGFACYSEREMRLRTRPWCICLLVVHRRAPSTLSPVIFVRSAGSTAVML
jgi:hypothetical protein